MKMIVTGTVEFLQTKIRPVNTVNQLNCLDCVKSSASDSSNLAKSAIIPRDRAGKAVNMCSRFIERLIRSWRNLRRKFRTNHSVFALRIKTPSTALVIALLLANFILTSKVMAQSETQAVTISSDAADPSGTGVTESYPFDFTVSVPNNVDTPLDVNYSADIVTPGLAHISGVNGGVVQIPAGQNSAVGTIAMSRNSEVLRDQQVALFVRITSGTGYTVGSPSTIIVVVKDNDHPTASNRVVSIARSSSAASILEGSAAEFHVSANPVLTSGSLAVTVAVDEIVSDGDSYLRGTVPRLETVTLTSANSSIEVLSLATGPSNGNHDDIDEDPGTITATIQEGVGYSLPDSNAAASIAIDDPTIISIANGPDLAEGEGPAVFKVQSNSKPKHGLVVYYTPVEATGRFLNLADGASGSQRVSHLLNFSREGNTGPFEADLEVTVDNDEDWEVDGSITVTLNPDKPATYSIDAMNNSATVNVTDDESPGDESGPGASPTISFQTLPPLYAAGNSLNWRVQFNKEYSGQSVFYEPRDEFGRNFTYADHSATKVTRVDPDVTSQIISLYKPVYYPDGQSFETGEVDFALVSDADSYILGGYVQDTVTFVNAKKPGITVAVNESTVKEGSTFAITVTSTPAPARDLTVRMNVVDPNDEENSTVVRIEIPAGSTSATKPFKTSVVSGSDTSRTMQVKVIAANTYYLVDRADSDTVTVSNAINFSIGDVATPVNEGGIATFTVTATEDPETAIAINYRAGGTIPDNNYLIAPVGSLLRTTLNFSDSDMDGTFTANLTVPLRLANGSDDFDDVITVELLDTGLGSSYGIDPENKTATVTILDDTVPELSIGNAPNAKANTVARFKITANKKPKKYLVVNFTPVERTTTFLEPTPSGTGVQRKSEPLEFIEDPVNSNWHAELEIPTRYDTNGYVSGSISVRLDEEARSVTRKNYTVSDTASSATVALTNQSFLNATISSPVAGTDGIGVTEGQPFVFTVSVPEIMAFDLEVAYTVSTTSPTEITGLVNGTVTIPRGQSSVTGNIGMAADSNVGQGSNSSITVGLVDGSSHNLGTPSSITVNVKDNDGASLPSVSIEGPTATTFEEGDSITFRVSTDQLIPTSPPGSRITVNVDIDETLTTSGNYLRGGARTLQVEITSAGNSEQTSTATKAFTVQTGETDGVADSIHEGMATITATVRDGTGYVLADSGVAASVTINDPLPVISITGPPALVESAGHAVFTIHSDSKPVDGLVVNYTPQNKVGNFLNTTLGASGVARNSGILTFHRYFPNEKFKAVLRLDLDNDTADEVDGEIAVELNLTDPATYAVDGQSGSASVAISDDDTDAPSTLSYIDQSYDRYVTGSWFRFGVKFSPAYQGRLTTVLAFDADGRFMKFREGSNYYTQNTTRFDPNITGGARTHPKPAQDHTGAAFTHGYVEYRLNSRGPGYYKLGNISSQHLWFVSDAKPGIELAIKENSISDGNEFTVKATATPAPVSPITVPFTFVDPNNLLAVTGGSIVIPAMTSSAEKKFQTRLIVGNRDAVAIGVVASPTDAFYLDDARAVDSVGINNFILLSIGDVPTPVNEGDTISVPVFADGNPGANLQIVYVLRKTEVGHNFFVDGRSNLKGAFLDFTGPDGNGNYTASLDLPLKPANGTDDNDNIYSITLDTLGLDGKFRLDDANKVTYVTIYDDTVPELSIVDSGLTSGETDLVFKVYANVKPKSALTLYYTPTETTTMVLDPSPTGSGIQRTTDPLSFSKDAASGKWVAELRIATRDNAGSSSISGTVSVELNSEPLEVLRNNYTVSSSESTGVARIGSELQTVSISSAFAGDNGWGVTEGRSFEFTVSVPEITAKQISVRYSVRSNLNTVSTTNAGNSVVIRAGTNSATGTVTLAPNSNTRVDADAKITVSLDEDPSYIVGSQGRIVVDVKDNDDADLTIVSISGPDATVLEGEPVTFTLRTNKLLPETPGNSSLLVNVDISESASAGESYLLNGKQRIQVELISADNDNATRTAIRTFTVPTGDADGTADDLDETEATISAKVRDGLNYVLSDTGHTAVATVDDPLPIISIGNSPAFFEYELAREFPIYSNIMPNGGRLMVNFTAVDMVGNYLDHITYAYGQPLTFSTTDFFRDVETGRFIGYMRIFLYYDGIPEVDGMISVTLNDDPNGKYVVSETGKSAIVRVTDAQRAFSKTARLINPPHVYQAGDSVPLTIAYSGLGSNYYSLRFFLRDSGGTFYDPSSRTSINIRDGYSSIILNMAKPDNLPGGRQPFSTGYVHFEMTSDSWGPRIGYPFETYVWFVDDTKPGIELTISENSINEGEEFTVRAKATPPPASAVTVPFTFVDPNNLLSVTSGSIEIPANQVFMEKKFRTNIVNQTAVASEIGVVATSAVSYYLDDSLKSDSVAVKVNIISVEDVTTPVSEGGTVVFSVAATEKPQSALSVNYTARGMRSDNNFLDFVPGSVQTANLTFRESVGNGNHTAELRVPLRTANSEDDHDDVVTVQLLAAGSEAGYVVDDMNGNATATIHDDSVPELKLTGAQITFSNNAAKFQVTSASEPKAGLRVNYTPTESTTMFLDPAPTGTGVKRLSDPLIFSWDPISILWRATLAVPTRSDPGGATSGTILVSLNAEGMETVRKNYTVSATHAIATVSISEQDEQNVKISSPVAGGNGKGVTEGHPFQVIVSVPEKTSRAIAVDYTVTTSNPTAVTGLTNGTITIPQGRSAASGLIAMASGSDVGSSGATITVTVVDGTGYSPDSPGSIVVEVKDNDDTTLTQASIEGPESNSVVEGDPITFTVRTNKLVPSSPSDASISVNVAVREAVTAGDSFLRVGPQALIVKLTSSNNDMSAGTASKTFTVATGEADGAPDDFGEDGATITATVRDGIGYVLPDSGASASVAIDDPLPVISIASAPTLGEGEGPAKFLISSDVNPNRGLVIGYIPENKSGNFLDETAGRSGGVRNSSILQFARIGSSGDFTSELPLNITSNDFDEVDGMISVTLSLQNPATYTIDAMNGDASVTVSDDDVDAAVTVELLTTADSVYVAGYSYEAGFEFNKPYPGNTIKFGAYDAEGNAYKFFHGPGNFQSYFTVTLPSTRLTTGSLQLPKPQLTHVGSHFAAGYVEYRILSGGANSYKLGRRISTQMWYLNGFTPGIELEITEDSVREGEEFTVKVTAIPAPTASPVRVPFAITDSNNWLTVSNSSIVIPIGKTYAVRKFQTSHLNGNQDDNEITVTVTPMDVFVVEESLASASVTVNNSIKLSIEDISTPVDEGGTVSFAITATGDPGIPVSFNYAAEGADPGNNFLMQTERTLQSARLTFTDSDGDGSFSANLLVPLRAVNGNDDLDDVITVELLETGLGTDFILDAMNRTATVTILDDTVPELSIADAPGVYSSLDAVFELSSTKKPKGPLSVHYTPTEATTTFLNPVPTGTGVMRTSPPLTFTEDTVNSKWVAELRVPTRINGGGSASGSITVALNAEGMGVVRKNYAVSTSDSTATVAVTAQPEQNVTISSVNASAIDQGGGITEGQPFAFTVSVPEGTTIELVVSYRVTTNSSTAITGLTSGTVTIPVGMNSASGTIAMAPGSDVASDAGATITVALVDGSDYNLGSPGNIVVAVKDNDDASLTVASIAGPAETAVVEGDSITFTVNLNRAVPATPPDSSVTVNVDVTETVTAGDSYLRGGGQTVRVTLTAADNAMNGTAASREFTVHTGETDGSPDDFDELEATITAAVRDGTGYVLADTGVIASVTIDDPVPVISISNAPTVAEDGGPALFPIRSDILPRGGTLTIRHTAVNTIGRFLDIDAAGYGEPGGRGTTKFTRVGGTGPFTANLAIPLNDDSDPEVDGTVTVTIFADPDGRYTLGAGSPTATVTVTDDEDTVATAASIARFPDVYQAGNLIILTLNYSGDGAVAERVYIGQFDEFGEAYHPPNFLYTPRIGTKSERLRVPKPTRHPNGGGTFTTGYVRFEILGSGSRYQLGHPMSGHVWYTDRDTSGISLSVMEGAVNEGQSFTVRATATPPSQHAISVPVEIADPHGLLADSVDTDNLSVEIPAEAMYGELVVPTKRKLGSQTENTLTVAAAKSANYHLDDSVATDTVSINYLPEVSVAAPTAGEDDGTLTFEVVLDENAGSGGVELPYSVAGTADGSSDYSIPAEYASPLTIPAGSNRISLVVNLTDDLVTEGNETIILRFSSATGAILPDGAASLEVTGTITDNDREPTVTVTPAVGSETGGMLSFPVEMDAVSGQDVTLAYEVAIPSGTATENIDFTLTETMIVIGAGKQTGQIDVRIEPDTMVEGEETFILDLTLINAVFSDGRNISTVTGTVTDLPLLTLVPVKTEFAETDYIHYAVTSDRPLTAEVTGTVSITADAVGVIDPLLTDDTATFTLTPSKQTDRLRIALEADSAPATVTVQLNGGTGYTVQPSQDRATLTVIEGTGLPEISVAGQGMVTPGSMAVFTVTETPAIGAPPRTEELTVNLAVTGNPVNFIAGTPGSSVILPVDATTETFRVNTSSSAVGQGTVTVEVLPGNGYKLAVTAAERTADVAVESTRLTVEVDDPPDTNENSGSMVFNFTLSGRAGPGGVSITYTVAGTATAGTDYTFVSPATAGNPVVIAEDGTSGTLELNLIADGRDEADETVILTFAATGAEFRPDENVAEGVIIDNDAEPTVSVADTVVAETEGRLAIPIELNAVSNRDVTLNYAVQPGGGALENSDFTLAGTSVTIAAGNLTGEIVATVLGDLLNEGEESFTLTLTATNAVFANGTNSGTVTGTITDLPLVTIDTAATTVADTDFIICTVKSNPVPTTSVTGSVLVNAGRGGVIHSANPTTTTEFTLTPTNPETILRVPLIPDSGPATVTVSLSDGTEYTVQTADDTITVDVVDGSALPEISIEGGESIAAGLDAMFTVRAAGRFVQRLTVNMAASAVPSGFLAGTHQNTAEIQVGNPTGGYSVPTVGSVTGRGVVTAEVLPGTGYRLAANPARRSAETVINGSPVTITVTSPTAGEGDGSLAFDIRLDEAAGTGGVSIDYAISGSATVGEDFEIPSTTVRPLVIPAESDRGRIEFTVLEDTVDEDSETVVLTLTATGGAVFAGGDNRATGTITDNDSEPTVTVKDAQAEEQDGKLIFAVELSEVSERDVTVSLVGSPGGTAVANSDYTLPPGPLTIRAGSRSGKISVGLVSDAITEGEETLTLNLTAVNAKFANGSSMTMVTGTITDLPLVSITSELREVADTDYIVYRVGTDAPLTEPVSGTVTITATRAGVVDTKGNKAFDFFKIGVMESAVVLTRPLVPGGGPADVVISLDRGAEYTVNPDQDRVTVGIADGTNLPAVSITGGDPVNPGEDAVFTVSVQDEPGHPRILPLTVNLGVSADRDGFLTGTHDRTVSVPVKDVATTYRVPIAAGDGEDATVTVAVLPGRDYKLTGVTGDRSAGVPVIAPPPLPVVTLEDVPTHATMGHSFTFTIRIAPPPAEPLDVAIALTGLDSEGADGMISSTSPGTALVRGGTGTVEIPVSGVLEVTVSTVKPKTLGNGVVAVELRTGSPAVYALGALNQATVTMKENRTPGANEPRLSISGPEDVVRVAEGGNVTFVIASSHVPKGPVMVAHATAQTGNFLVNDTESYSSVELSLSGRNTTLAVDLVDPPGDQPDGTVTVTLLDGNGYVLADSPAHMATVNVTDDVELETISINAENPRIEEGDDAVFIISSSNRSSSATVQIAVSQIGSNIFGPVGNTMVLQGGEVSLVIPTIDDSRHREVGGAITVAVLPNGTAYGINQNSSSASVTIADNDPQDAQSQLSYSVASTVVGMILNEVSTNNQASGQFSTATSKPQISIRSTTESIEEGSEAIFALRTPDATESGFPIRLELTESGGLLTGSLEKTLQMPPNESIAYLTVPTIDDDLAEENGSITVRIMEDANYAIGSENITTIIVTDNVDRLARRSQVSVANQVALAEMAESVGTGSLRMATERVTQAFNPGSGNKFTLAGQSTLTGLITSGGESMNGESLSLQEVLGTSSFELGLYPENGLVNPATIWGFGSLNQVTGSDSAISNGEIFAGHFGIDTRINDSLVTGLSTSSTNGEFEIQIGSESMRLKSAATGLHPYVGFQSENGDLQLRMTAGYGSGEVELGQARYDSENWDSRFFNVGVSGLGRVYAGESTLLGGTSEVRISGEAWTAGQTIYGDNELPDDVHSLARHSQMTAEWIQEHEIVNGVTLNSLMQIGLWDKSIDVQSIRGVELGSSLELIGLQDVDVVGGGQMSLSGTNQVREWGLFSSLEYDSGNDNLGLLFDVAPEWGYSNVNESELVWDGNFLDHDHGTDLSQNGGKLDVTAGYGLSVGDGIDKMKLFGGMNLNSVRERDYRLGSELNLNQGASVEFEGSSIHVNGNRMGNKLRFEGVLRW